MFIFFKLKRVENTPVIPLITGCSCRVTSPVILRVDYEERQRGVGPVLAFMVSHPRHRLPVAPPGRHQHTGRTAGRHGCYNCLLLQRIGHSRSLWLNQNTPLHPSSLPRRQNSQLLWDGGSSRPLSVFCDLCKKGRACRLFTIIFCWGRKEELNRC